MPLPKLELRPLRTSYGATHPDSSHYVRLEGGLGKNRLDQLGSSATVAVRWALTALEYQYFLAFWRTLEEGALPFLIDLVLEGPDLVEYVAQFLPGTVGTSEPSPEAFTVDATLEVEPSVPDPETDQSIVDLFTVYGLDGPSVLDRLAQFVNEDLDLPALNP